MPEAELDPVSGTLPGPPDAAADDSPVAPAFGSRAFGSPAVVATPSASAASTADPAASPTLAGPDPVVATEAPALFPKRHLRLLNPPVHARPHVRLGKPLQLALAFAVGAIASLALGLGASLAVAVANEDRALPGVHVGTVDVSGLSRDQIVARLQTNYSYLGQGSVVITTPTGEGTISYAQAGRVADVEYMTDQALRAGHTGDPIADALTAIRGAVVGETVPIAVRVDPTQIATNIRALTLSSQQPPHDAQATQVNGSFTYSPSSTGTTIDESALSSAIVDRLSEPGAPVTFQIGDALVRLEPRVSDADAAAAIAAAQRMVVDVNLTFAPAAAASSGQSPSPSPTGTAAKRYTIPAQTIQSWISFTFDSQGNYGPVVNSSELQSYLAKLPGGVLVAPVEPKVTFDTTGNPSGVQGGQDGVGIDPVATAKVVSDYLAGLAAGGSPKPSLDIVTGPIPPRITVGNLSDLTIIGAWTTIYYPGESNGNGANIAVPAKVLNGQIVAPGQRFSFLSAVGPIDAAHGYTSGGVIVRGHSEHTGAMGGGICSASTTMFNAAARAGLQIDQRHAHFYYINRYPIGLDATVYSNGYTTWDLWWTNDTPNPIVIRSWTSGHAKAQMTIQLWSLPTGRTVTFSPEFMANVVKATNKTVYVSTLPAGQQYWAEYATPGFDTSRTRTVTDATGKVIHTDTWNSHYTKVDGLLEIGGSAPTPPPAPTPAPTPTSFLPLPFLGFALRAWRRLRGAAESE
jgi:vancomycin resistance protein YoaR